MSRLLLLAGSPALPALEARQYSAYDGCLSLDTSTASSVYSLAQSDPPTCAATCGDEYEFVAIQAQFCFCFPSPPDLYTTYNDSDCSINCDPPYQDESCGGVTSGSLIDLYSFYAGSDITLPATPSDDTSGSSSLAASQPASSPSERPDTSVGPTTTDQPSPVTPGPVASATGEPSATTGLPGTAEPSISEGNTGVPGVGISTVAAPGPELTTSDGTGTQAPSEPPLISFGGSGNPDVNPPGPTTAAVSQVVSEYTITLWTTVTSYTTVYPGGPLQSTILSIPAGTTRITAKVFTSTCSAVTVTNTCEDGSVWTTVLPGPVHVVTYNPYVSELTEVEVEGTGNGAITRTVLAAVVPVETTTAAGARRDLPLAPSEGTPVGNTSAIATSSNGQLTTAAPGLSGSWAGTGWVVTATETQVVNVSATQSQFPVTAGAAGAAGAELGWQDSMMVAVLAVVLGVLWM